MLPAAPAGAGSVVRPGRAGAVHDLRGCAGCAADAGGRRELRYPAGDILVASGLPGSGKSTLIKRVAPVPKGHETRGSDGSGPAGGREDTVRRVDSQDTRERWERRLPARLPYVLYRPLVRCAHYAHLRRAVRSGASVVVHDCGAMPWVRRWLAREARRSGRRLHLLLLDVDPAMALQGQATRGRRVSGYAFGRHRRAVRRLVAEAEGGRPSRGCASVVLLDRVAAGALRGIAFECRGGRG